jgi:hypothetical protein
MAAGESRLVAGNAFCQDLDKSDATCVTRTRVEAFLAPMDRDPILECEPVDRMHRAKRPQRHSCVDPVDGFVLLPHKRIVP